MFGSHMYVLTECRRSFRKQQVVVDGLAVMSAVGIGCYALSSLITPSPKKY